MDLKRLRYFCAIVEHGQISRAAKALNIAQPPLSQRLKELEEEFGVQLIRRDNHGCEVTEAGRRLYERARIVLSEIDEISGEIGQAAARSATVVVGVSSTCASFLRAPLRQLAESRPDIRLRVLLGDSTWLESMVRQRGVDFALMQAPEDENGLFLQPLPIGRFVVLVPRAAVDPAWDDRLRLEAIASFPLLLLRRFSGTGSYERLIRTFRARGLSPDIVMDCSDVRVLRDACAAGARAITILPETEMREYVSHDIAVFRLDEPEIVFHPFVARPCDHRSGPEIDLVIREILSGAEAA
ncbi:putative Helix-turn-helix transcriptional regulator, LysR family [uncultured Alphaproteobacteria bacterium]|uniref:Putative Helix-turn-helix transcriptional regulator, LysR family n=1 Tax=uncultured Alphaproteobacteria bacterium TaxID=91750 RepID=A0A212KHZ5_9PROT|nr:putative Helix-turn-helix transcriptional regulator, LysR family [uncultured Alphaproteobacteria bacterium]